MRKMPAAPEPGELPGRLELAEQFAGHLPEGLRNWLERERPIEERYAGAVAFLQPEQQPPHQQVWFRAAGRSRGRIGSLRGGGSW